MSGKQMISVITIDFINIFMQIALSTNNEKLIGIAAHVTLKQWGQLCDREVEIDRHPNS